MMFKNKKKSHDESNSNYKIMPTKAKAVIKSHKCGAITSTGRKCKKNVRAGRGHCKAHTQSHRKSKASAASGYLQTEAPAGFVNRKSKLSWQDGYVKKKSNRQIGPRRPTGRTFVPEKGSPSIGWKPQLPGNVHAHYKKQAKVYSFAQKELRKTKAAAKLVKQKLKEKERNEKKAAKDLAKAKAKAAKVGKPKKKRKRKKKPNLSIIV